MKRACTVCGARVRNHNPKVTQCDRVCIAAAKAGRTREQQLADDLKNPSAIDDENYARCRSCGFFASQCQCWDPVNGDR